MVQGVAQPAGNAMAAAGLYQKQPSQNVGPQLGNGFQSSAYGQQQQQQAAVQASRLTQTAALPPTAGILTPHLQVSRLKGMSDERKNRPILSLLKIIFFLTKFGSQFIRN